MNIQQQTFSPAGKRILLVSAHPDDADFGAGGTLISWLKQGAHAAIVVATNGNKGTGDRQLSSTQLAQIRQQEQINASQKLGLDHTWFLDYEDAHLEVTQDLKEKLVKIIREYKPDAVITFDPSVLFSLKRHFINHPDHRAIGQATLDAVFPMARDFLTFPHLVENGLEPHTVSDIFLYNFDNPSYYVNITDVWNEKVAVLKTHTSQMGDREVAIMREWAKLHGQAINVELAEAFVHIHLS